MDFWHWASEGGTYLVLLIATGSSLGALINHAIEFKNKASKPKQELAERMDALDRKLDEFTDTAEEEHKEYEARFKRDLERHNKNAVESKIILRSMLTLIKSSIDGNHVEELKERQEEIQSYLIEKA